MENESNNNRLSAVVERRRDMLLAVADLARNALDETADYAGRGAVVDAHCTLDVALARIRKELGCESNETALDVGTRANTAKRSCFDALEDKCGLRLNFFGTGARKMFVGVRQTEIDSPHNNAHIFQADATRVGHIEFKRDGDLLATVDLNVNRTRVDKIVCHILGDIILENLRRNRLRKKNRAAKRAAEGLK